MNVVRYEDGRYPFAAGADQVPGDVIVRPDGSLALLDGVDTVKSGALISPNPIKNKAVMFDSASGSTFAVADSVYWDAAAKLATATSSGNTLLGKAARAKTSASSKSSSSAANFSLLPQQGESCGIGLWPVT